MNILIICQYFYPESFKINDIAFELVKRGHNVEILTGYPNYPDGYYYEGYKDKNHNEEIINGVKVHRVRIAERKKGFLNLCLNYVSYAFLGYIRAKKIKSSFDVVLIYQLSPITQGIPSFPFKRKGIPIVLYCQDIWPESIKVYGFEDRNLVFKLIKKMSAKIYQKANRLIVSSPGFIAYLNQICNINKEKMVYLPNFGEDVFLKLQPNISSSNKVNLVFAGNIGKAQNLDILVYSLIKMDKTMRSRLKITIIGSGSYLESFIELVNKEKMNDNFEFIGRKKQEELIDYYSKADAFFISLVSDNKISLTIPTKLMGYMCAGKPIIGAIDDGARELIEESRCGVCCNADDPDSLMHIFNDLVNHKEKYEEMGRNGREYYLNNFTFSIHIKKLENVMEDLCQSLKVKR